MRKLIQLPGFLYESYRSVFILYLLVVLALSIQSLLLPGRIMTTEGPPYFFYNNYIIFKQAYFHLINYQDLYVWYLQEQFDLFKYSPTFALLFGFFSYLPNSIGLTLWNLINAFCLFYAIRQLPKIDQKIKISILIYILLELTTSVQSAQSNALIAGLIILAYTRLEERQYFWATLFINITVYIKLFGLFAFVLLLFYPGKSKLIGYSVFWFVLLFFLPLIAISPDQLNFLYSRWADLLSHDHPSSPGPSVVGWLESWFHWVIDKRIIVLTGLLIFLLPLMNWKRYEDYTFRLITLASVLLWVVIFNHMAESQTFIIAVTGIGLWFFLQRRTLLNVALVVLAYVFTCLSPTDIFPNYIQENYFDLYTIKVVPCIFIWLKIVYDSLVFNKDASLQLT